MLLTLAKLNANYKAIAAASDALDAVAGEAATEYRAQVLSSLDQLAYSDGSALGDALVALHIAAGGNHA